MKTSPKVYFPTALLICFFLVIVTDFVFGQPSKQKTRFLLGIGGGFGNILKTDIDQSSSGPNLYGRAGFGVGKKLMLMVEIGLHHLNDETPDTSDITNDKGTFRRVRDPKVFETLYYFVALQIPLYQGLFVRPGVGLGTHSFASYTTVQNAVTNAEVSKETGPALGLSVGYEKKFAEKFAAAGEIVLRWSSGEDSSNSRRAVGFQAVGIWYF